MTEENGRRLPVGAEVVSTGGVHFRIWAPEKQSIEVELEDVESKYHHLKREHDGYWSGLVASARPGMRYKYRVNGQDSCPDPASRFQPDGPHQPSKIIDPDGYAWRDRQWKGNHLNGQVIYEMHIGTFTNSGTWQAAESCLQSLADTGITVIELMPVAEFPGRFGWGYDGVHPFAPTHLYGTTDDFRHFVDSAHALGMGVILDVVYNHLGPDGNYLPCFSKDYFTDLHETDWGEAINYYGPNSAPVREFFVANAGYWISEYHLDGLRLDATQNIYDESEDHILAAMVREVRRAAAGRAVIIVAENEPQQMKLVRSPEEGGYGMDGVWNDDFHHSAMVELIGRNEAYYTDYLGKPQEFISAAKYGFLYQGQWYKWQSKRRGTPSFGASPEAFINFIQNHDQIANSPRGERCTELTAFGKFKAMSALFMLMPGTPMLFQGEEWGTSTPFLFFADTKPDLAPLVREGRRKFMAQFRSVATPAMAAALPDPGDLATFERCKLDHGERERPRNYAIWLLHRDLLRLRRTEAAFALQWAGAVDGAVLSESAFVLRFFGPEGRGTGEDRLLIVNFGRDLYCNPAPEPLLAPPEQMEWNVLWSSENPVYEGSGSPELDTVENWKIPGHAAIALKPAPRSRTEGCNA